MRPHAHDEVAAAHSPPGALAIALRRTCPRGELHVRTCSVILCITISYAVFNDKIRELLLSLSCIWIRIGPIGDQEGEPMLSCIHK